MVLDCWLRNPGMLGIGMVDGTAGSSDRLAPGESLVMYTDGLPDAMDPADVLFGEERLTTILQSHHGANPEEILNLVDSAITSHTAPADPPTTSTSSCCNTPPSNHLRPSLERGRGA